MIIPCELYFDEIMLNASIHHVLAHVAENGQHIWLRNRLSQ